MSKRIVVTGMGAITPLGCGVEQVWRRLLAGQSGIRSLPEELIGELSTTIGGQVPDSLQDPEAGSTKLLPYFEDTFMEYFGTRME